MSEEKLPPLQPINPEERLKRELYRLDSRLNKIDININEFKSNIPLDLNSTLQQLQYEIDQLNGKNDPKSNDCYPLDEELQTLEKNSLERIQIFLQEHTLSLNLKASKLQSSLENSSENTKNLNSFQQQALNKRIDNLKQMIQQQNSDIDKRISTLKEKLVQYSKNSKPEISEQLHQLASQLNTSRSDINEILNEINEIQSVQQNRTSIPATFSKDNSSIQDDDDDSQNTSLQTNVPDLTEDFSELESQIKEFKESFNIKLSSAKAEMDNVEKKIKVVKEMGDELSIASQSFESRVIEADNLCNSLLEQVNNVAKEIGADKNVRLIHALTSQIQSLQSNMKRDIDDLKERVKKIESLQPLVKF